MLAINFSKVTTLTESVPTVNISKTHEGFVGNAKPFNNYNYDKV